MGDDIRVQIYTAQSVSEAGALVEIGVDHVGVTPAARGLPGEIATTAAAEICDALRGSATSVALSVETDLGAIAAMVDAVRPAILHLCGPPGTVGPEDVARLRSNMPGVAVMQAIAVTGPEAVGDAVAYAAVADYLLLDSVTPELPGVGAAGVTHDWGISATIVGAVDLPVVLAGGLSPENVAAAVTAVRPWGVDSLTHTNRPLGGNRFEKDLRRVSQFVEAARRVALP